MYRHDDKCKLHAGVKTTRTFARIGSNRIKDRSHQGSSESGMDNR